MSVAKYSGSSLNSARSAPGPRTANRGLLSDQQQGFSLLRILVVLMLICALLALAYLFLIGRESGTTLLSSDVVQQSQPQQGGSGDSSSDSSADSSQPFTPEQLQTLTAVPEMATEATGPDAQNRDPEAGAGQTATAAAKDGEAAISGSRLNDERQAYALSSALSENLPALNSSDPVVKETLVDLGSQQLLEWMVDDELVRRFVVTVDNIAAGKLPRKHLFFEPIQTPFRAQEEADSYWLGGYNYARYNTYVELLSRLDAAQLVAMYRQFYPLLQQAYAQLGYPSRSFHERLQQAIDQVLQAPIREQPLELAQPSVRYTYADPELEALSAVDKQMLRLGPDHTRTLKQQLLLVREHLSRLQHRR